MPVTSYMTRAVSGINIFEGDYAAKYVYAAYINIISSTQSLLHATRSYFSKLNDIMQKIRGIEYFKKILSFLSSKTMNAQDRFSDLIIQ